VRILVAGDWHSDLHEEPVYQALLTLGHQAHRFPWHRYYLPAGAGRLAQLACRLQNRVLAGPLLTRINDDFLAAALEVRPEVLFVYRGTHITRNALQAVKRQLPNTVLIGYNNDDPFARDQSRLLWRHFLKAVPAYDLMCAYRSHNLADFQAAGARRVELLRSWFVPERNHPVELSGQELQRFACDLVFAGHYEPDGRLELIEGLASLEGVDFRLFGPEWRGVAERSPVLRRLAPVVALAGADYNKALCGAKIALCLLSKLNRDTYTRRCFEIPAAGSFLLAEYSDDLASLFREGVEAEFFRSPGELGEKVRYYLAHDAERRAIAAAGRERVVADGHDVVSRMRTLLARI
jgi:spore maturation protein CgeB